jgi:hypothetical protein
MSDPDDEPPTLTRSRVLRELRHLLEGLTPIDFPDLERRGVLQKAPHETGWYLVLKPAELPAYARQQALGAGQTTVGDRTVPMLWFQKSTNRKAAALLAQINRRLVRPRDVMAH